MSASGPNSAGARPKGLSMRFSSFRSFVERFSSRISEDGIFIETDEPLEVGTPVHFEISLSEEFRLLKGIGEVVWRVDPGTSADWTPGMAIRFQKIDAPTERLVRHLVASWVAEGGTPFSLVRWAMAEPSAEGARTAAAGPEPAMKGEPRAVEETAASAGEAGRLDPSRPFERQPVAWETPALEPGPPHPEREPEAEAPRQVPPETAPAEVGEEPPAEPEATVSAEALIQAALRGEIAEETGGGPTPLAREPETRAGDERAAEAGILDEPIILPRLPEDEELGLADLGAGSVAAEPEVRESRPSEDAAPVPTQAPEEEVAASGPPVIEEPPIPSPEAPPVAAADGGEEEEFEFVPPGLGGEEDGPSLEPPQAFEPPAEAAEPAPAAPSLSLDSELTPAPEAPADAFPEARVAKAAGGRRGKAAVLAAILALSVAVGVYIRRAELSSLLGIGDRSVTAAIPRPVAPPAPPAAGEAPSATGLEGESAEGAGAATGNETEGKAPETAGRAAVLLTGIDRVTWETTATETILVLEADGRIVARDFELMRVGSGAPRELIKILGVRRQFAANLVDVGTAQVRRIRIGLHPMGARQDLHFVADLTGPEVRVLGTEIRDNTLRIRFGAAPP